MTTKTGEALRGRKRAPEVMAKARATRRKNARAAKRAAKANARGSKKRTRLTVANRSIRLSKYLNSPMTEAAKNNLDFLKSVGEASLAAIEASESAGVNLANQNPMDAQLVDEFVGRCLETKRSDPGKAGLNAVPWSQLDAVLRRLGVVF